MHRVAMSFGPDIWGKEQRNSSMMLGVCFLSFGYLISLFGLPNHFSLFLGGFFLGF